MKQVWELNGGTMVLTHWEELSNPSLISNTLPRETLHNKNASTYLGRKMWDYERLKRPKKGFAFKRKKQEFIMFRVSHNRHFYTEIKAKCWVKSSEPLNRISKIEYSFFFLNGEFKTIEAIKYCKMWKESTKGFSHFSHISFTNHCPSLWNMHRTTGKF